MPLCQKFMNGLILRVNDYIMNKYSTVDSNEKASAFMEARLWEFIDMAAMWPEAKPDSRIWDHVMVYAPKKEWVKLSDQEVWDAIEHVLEGGGWLDVAEAIEAKVKERNNV